MRKHEQLVVTVAPAGHQPCSNLCFSKAIFEMAIDDVFSFLDGSVLHLLRNFSKANNRFVTIEKEVS